MGILHALQHIGYSILAQADCGWIGRLRSKLWRYRMEREKNRSTHWYGFRIYKQEHHLYDLRPAASASALKKQDGYPAYGNSRKEWDDYEHWAFDNPEYR